VDFDLVAVMEDGGIEELGNPQELLADPNSMFTRLVNDGAKRKGEPEAA
jgi:ABC-type multidrug transport system fused ATPase/permease subunit